MEEKTDLIEEAFKWFVAAEVFRYLTFASAVPVVVFGWRWLLVTLIVFVACTGFAIRSAWLIKTDKEASHG